ncbi:MAG: di-heme enzyme [Gammaproteobacteria bacterium]|nr:di-heme enzyme [Gammaproteobacteria bacterium]
MRLLIVVFLFIVTSFFVIGCEQEKPSYQWSLREGFPKPQVPENNPMTEAKVELGRWLFYDKSLSANKTQSCASCHIQSRAFADLKQNSLGSTGDIIKRNSPALVNIAYNQTLTWAHPGINNIEQQLLIPMFNESPTELGITGHEQEVLKRFDNEHYENLFNLAFGSSEASFNRINQAIASFVRSLISLNSPFDRYAYDNDDSALSESALRGLELFFSERLECHHCHGGFNFTQSTLHEKQLLDRQPFHNTGLYNLSDQGAYPATDQGLFDVTGKQEDRGKFRAPTLRNIALTAPYMHDGTLETLEQVIDFYAAGGRNISSGPYQGDGRINPNKSQFVKGFELTEDDKKDLLNFLHSLTDDYFINNPQHQNPFQKPTATSEH